MSLAELSKATGINEQTLMDRQRPGIHRIRKRTLRLLAAFLSVDPQELAAELSPIAPVEPVSLRTMADVQELERMAAEAGQSLTEYLRARFPAAPRERPDFRDAARGPDPRRRHP
jgi:hypothetical protein